MYICIYIDIYADVHAYHADKYRQIESEEVVNAMPMTSLSRAFGRPISVSMSIRTCVESARVYLFVFIHLCLHVSNIYVLIYIYAYICICIYIHTYICICIYTYTDTCMYRIHLYSHI